jgi:outer membrane protein assembly factor BamB
VSAGGRVYLIDREGTGLVLKPGAELEVLATNKLGDKVDASPAAVGRQLIVRGERFLWCIEAK